MDEQPTREQVIAAMLADEDLDSRSPAKIAASKRQKHDESVRSKAPLVQVFKCTIPGTNGEPDRPVVVVFQKDTIAFRADIRGSTSAKTSINGVALGQISGGMPPRFLSEIYHQTAAEKYDGPHSPALDYLLQRVPREVGWMVLSFANPAEERQPGEGPPSTITIDEWLHAFKKAGECAMDPKKAFRVDVETIYIDKKTLDYLDFLRKGEDPTYKPARR